MFDPASLGYGGISDTTLVRAASILQEKSKKIGIFNDSVVKGIMNPRLKERESEKEYLSHTLAFKEAVEISEIVLGLNSVYDTIEHFPEPVGFLPFIESKVSEIADEAKDFLIMDTLLCDIIGEILSKIGHILVDLEPEIKLYVSRDMEIDDWKEFVFSVGIREGNFSKIIKLWDEIEEVAEKVIDGMKAKCWGMSHIETIDKMLSLEVRRLKNV